MTSAASRRSRDAEREALKRQADRATSASTERDELMAMLIQAKTLLDVGDVEGARHALAVGTLVEVLPARSINLIGFAADFSAMCIARRVRAAWFTTSPDETDPTGKRVSVSTGGESHHDALLARALESYAKVNELRAGERLLVPLSPDEIRATYPEVNQCPTPPSV